MIKSKNLFDYFAAIPVQLLGELFRIKNHNGVNLKK